jgi:hypothetical protein
MNNRRRLALVFLAVLGLAMAGASRGAGVPAVDQKAERDLARTILADPALDKVAGLAENLLRSGFRAGDQYAEVWIRDTNSFMELACAVASRDSLKKYLRLFFQFQELDGGILDGVTPAGEAKGGYHYYYSPFAPDYAGHKNTVETDQESSLVQAVATYVQATGDAAFLDEVVAGRSVRQRLRWALEFVRERRMARKYGLVYGATTQDWGDVQPEHPWGVEADENTHWSVGIYANAMFALALEKYIGLAKPGDPDVAALKVLRRDIAQNAMKYLWDEKRVKFIPHLYLDHSPFSADFDENAIYYHGGTSMAIKAGFLSAEQVREANRRMLDDMKKAGADSIGLNFFPVYPKGTFLNPQVDPWSYLNGGDWTWFGAYAIQNLVRYGFAREAYDEVRPMIDRTLRDGQFREWYDRKGEGRGSAGFRGAAGTLWKAIRMLKEWARGNS